VPPRFAYWTIILDGAPTSFRTRERDEILPLFNQLKAKNAGAELKWFSGGKLWESPDQAKEARQLERVRVFRDERKKQEREARGPGREPGTEGSPEDDPLAEFRRQHGRPADGSDQKAPAQERSVGSPRPWSPGPSERRAGPPREWSHGSEDSGSPKADRRGKGWRPGGEHKDPRDKYKLPPGQARKRWKERNLGPRPFGKKPFESRPPGEQPGGERPPGPPKPFGKKPFGQRPFGGKPAGPGGPRSFGGKRAGPGGPRSFGVKPSGPGGPRSFGGKPSGPRRPFGDKPPRSGAFDRRPPRGPRHPK